MPSRQDFRRQSGRALNEGRFVQVKLHEPLAYTPHRCLDQENAYELSECSGDW